MKKLQLKALKLGAKELLTREQLKNVLGGSGSDGGSDDDGSGGGSYADCSTTCLNGKKIEIKDCKGTCTATTNSSVSCSDPQKTVNCPVI